MNSQAAFDFYSTYVVLVFAQSILAWEYGRKRFVYIMEKGPGIKIKIALFLYLVMALWYFTGKLDFPIKNWQDAWPLLISLMVYLVARIIPPADDIAKLNSFLEAKDLYYAYLRGKSINELMTEEEINDAKSSESLTRAEMLFRISIELLQNGPRNEAAINDLGIVFYQLGMLLRLQGKSDEATSALMTALENLKELQPNENRLRSISGCYYHLGLINEAEKRNIAATEYYNESLKIDQQLNDENEIELISAAIKRCNH